MAKKRRKKRLPLFLAEDEISAFLEHAKSDRDRLFVICGIFLGLRVQELSKLRVRDVNLGRGMLFVREGKGCKDRALPLHYTVKSELARALAGRQPGDPVFISPKLKGFALQPRAMQLIIKRLAKAAQLPDADKPRHYTPHKMRHYFATKLIEAGVPITEVSELLGHENVATTQVYLHVNPNRLKSAVDKLQLPAAPEPPPPIIQLIEQTEERPLLRLVEG